MAERSIERQTHSGIVGLVHGVVPKVEKVTVGH
jgi:hypothetical protein